ncbi:MAG TPA: MBL fold metallo-hydrolase [Alicycliphilus sp.]|jgi:glyoxylase-like metal-dependent hydrolase (beta-lactamase superfamily II)|nr:MBL fold metallo-hydrolase [Alicycliphilus sp.]MBP8138665.1 MBL fold metallo-hydrolase [Alicycliphilus sp.]HRM50132.1 MBL fold metallo-hydrolase [Alicycliphilus sp.]HRM95134.1 MBL fold metallo-hydrolase [Alicycliphilus sp.]HRN65258.1 MBL fold metallo-hydrolase [Alicycliphilus sp.]
MPLAHIALPPEIIVMERSWLSANNLLFLGRDATALVDSGYCSNAAQTVALVQSSLGGRPLDLLLNTHLHSDHCGGNAALQARWPAVQTWIPPGQWDQVQDWDPVALSYAPTGQDCPRFRAEARLMPGSEVQLGDRAWQVHAAPGHDNHAVLLFEPRARLLISGDALWENGFGVVFPELDGEDAFAEVGATLDLIARLQPLTVIPGHGGVFADVPEAIARARRRLAGFEADPVRHARYAAKVLLKYKLLEWQQAPLTQVHAWLAATPYYARLHQRYFADRMAGQWTEELVQELIATGAARREGETLHNA